MKHIKIFLSFLLISAVFLCSGCNFHGDGLIDNVTTPDATATPETVDGIVNFKMKVKTDYCRAGDPVGEVSKEQSEMHALKSPVSYLPADIKILREEYLYDDGTIPESYVKNAAEWLCAVYSTAYYNDREQMYKNLQSRYNLLSDAGSAYIESIKEKLTDSFMPETAKQTVNGDIRMVCGAVFRGEDKNGAEYNGILINLDIFFTADSMENLETAYIKENDCALYNPTYTDEKTVSASLGSHKVMVFFDSSGKIAGWNSYFSKLSDSPVTRYMTASKEGVRQGEELLRLPLLADSSLKYSHNYTLGTTGRKIQQVGISCYKEIIGLSGSANDNYFDSFLNNCSEGLKSALQKSGILEEMIADARKYNIKFTLDPKNTRLIGKELSMLEVYRNTDYGDVYKIERACYLKTGSNEFNKKYGLPEDARFANFVFYVADENGTGKLVAFDIHARLAGDEFFNDLDQVWQGNWDKG